MYPQLEEKVTEIISTGTLDSKRQVAFQTFLFTIMYVDHTCARNGLITDLSFRHRASKIEPVPRLEKLRGFITPVQQLWQDPALSEAVSSFGGFCELLGLTKVRDYLAARRVHEIRDWGSYQLDLEGQAIQKELDERVKVCE